jgi:nucleotide-binding universal stress UspA family protein
MDKIKKILAPTDLSELSQAGIRYALNLARALGAEVTVYHVVELNGLTRSGDGVEGSIADATLQ